MTNFVKLVTNDKEYHFKHIDISKFKDNACILIIGKKKAGKTTDCINIICKKFKNCIDYSNNGYVIGKDECLVRFIKKFDAIDGRNKLDVPELITYLNNDSSYIVCDNCINFKSSDVLEKVISSDNKLRIITMDFPFYIKPELIAKIDYIFVHNSGFYTAKKKIYNLYGKTFGTFKEFEHIYDNLTDNYNCMVIDNTLSTSFNTQLTDKVFWYNSYSNYRQHVDLTISDENESIRVNKVNLVHIMDNYYEESNCNEISNTDTVVTDTIVTDTLELPKSGICNIL